MQSLKPLDKANFNQNDETYISSLYFYPRLRSRHYINIFYTYKYLKQINFDYRYWKDLQEFRQNLSMTKEHYKTTQVSTNIFFSYLNEYNATVVHLTELRQGEDSK